MATEEKITMKMMSDQLAAAMKSIEMLTGQMQTDREASADAIEEVRTENAALKKESKSQAQEVLDALATMRNNIDQANQADFDKREKESAARCRIPLAEEERVLWVDLERRAKTHGFDEKPSPAEMLTLGEYRTRAKLSKTTTKVEE